MNNNIDYIVMTIGSPPNHYRGWITIHSNLDDAKLVNSKVKGKIFQRTNIGGKTILVDVENTL